MNSNKEPFGVTFKGKSKDYILAHEKFKSMIVKNKNISTSGGKIKILDATNKQGFINATVEVLDENKEKGNVDLKVYHPSKKGATIEIRKISDYEYRYVEILKGHIADILDKNIEDQETSGGCKLFTCNICNWQTRVEALLKGHKKRMHASSTKTKPHFCSECDFKTVNPASLSLHKCDEHVRQTRKRAKVTFKCDLDKCQSTFYYESNLKEHKMSQHEKTNDQNPRNLANKSPSSSPPRKKIDNSVKECEEEMLDLDSMEIVVENELSTRFLLEKRIKELELLVDIMEEEKKKNEEEKRGLIEENKKLKQKESLVKLMEEEKKKDDEEKLKLLEENEKLKKERKR